MSLLKASESDIIQDFTGNGVQTEIGLRDFSGVGN